MKTIPLMIASTLLFASVTATAGTTVRSEHDTLATSFVTSKAAAYQQGENLLAQLKTDSAQKLSSSLSIHSGSADTSTIHLDQGAFVTVEERMDANGKLGYVGLVNVDYSYTESD